MNVRRRILTLMRHVSHIMGGKCPHGHALLRYRDGLICECWRNCGWDWEPRDSAMFGANVFLTRFRRQYKFPTQG